MLNCCQGDDPELSLSELAQRAGLPVSTAHRPPQAIVGLGRQVHGALTVQSRSARLDSELVRAVVPAMRIAADRIAPLLQTADCAAYSAAEFRSR